jgi:hypothetical protein
MRPPQPLLNLSEGCALSVLRMRSLGAVRLGLAQVCSWHHTLEIMEKDDAHCRRCSF